MVSRGSVSIGAGVRLALHADVEKVILNVLWEIYGFSLGSRLRISVEDFGWGFGGRVPEECVWVVRLGEV